MKDLYKILGVATDCDPSEFDYHRKKKLYYGTFGSDHDNIREIPDINMAYKVLSNKTFRFLYDIKRGTPRNQRYPVVLDNETEQNDFLSVIEEKLLSLNEQNQKHLNDTKKLKAEIEVEKRMRVGETQQHTKTIKDLEDRLNEEKERCFGMENTMSDLLQSIDNQKAQIEEISMKSRLEIDKLNEDIQKLQHWHEIAEKHKERLIDKFRGYNIYARKLVIATVIIMCFLFFLIQINL